MQKKKNEAKKNEPSIGKKKPPVAKVETKTQKNDKNSTKKNSDNKKNTKNNGNKNKKDMKDTNDKEKKDTKNANNITPVLHKKDRRIDDKEFHKYEDLLNKKTHRPKKESSKKKSD